MAEKKVLMETSARHIHVSQKDLEILFGAGYQLTNKKDLSQPGQFACEERVTVKGPKGEFKMSILGPTRPATQIEISATDARSIGVKAPVRESGDTAGTPGVVISGPCGEVALEEGVMIAKRHIHMTPEDAAKYGLQDKQIVSVKVGGDRGVTFDQTVVRVSPKFALAMHIDTDEANACGAAGELYGDIIA